MVKINSAVTLSEGERGEMRENEQQSPSGTKSITQRNTEEVRFGAGKSENYRTCLSQERISESFTVGASQFTLYVRGRQIISVWGSMANVFGSVDRLVCIATTQICHLA